MLTDTKINVIFYKGKGGLFSKLIRWFKRTKYSHCEIMFSNNMCGTSSEKFNKVLYYKIQTPLNTNDWDIIEIVCNSEEEFLIQNVFSVEESSCGYDWLGIFLCQIFPWGRQHPEKWFCSEICTYALKRISHLKKYLDNIKPHYIDPGELYDILEKISKENNKVIVLAQP